MTLNCLCRGGDEGVEELGDEEMRFGPNSFVPDLSGS